MKGLVVSSGKNREAGTGCSSQIRGIRTLSGSGKKLPGPDTAIPPILPNSVVRILTSSRIAWKIPPESSLRDFPHAFPE